MSAKRKLSTEFSAEAKHQRTATALPLIEVRDGQYHVGQAAVEFLASLNAPLAVVAVAGAYRTGKSFLLNRVLLRRGNGFGVGGTVNACTKGIWLWTEPIELEGKQVLIMDTEGLGAVNATDTHDSRIFALALLLSSYFIYNSVGTIGEAAISTLSLVANLSKHIRLQSSDESSAAELAEYFPDFMWVVRDFALELVDEKGDRIMPQQYLDLSLIHI